MDGAAAVSNAAASSCRAGGQSRQDRWAAVTRSERTKNCGLHEAPDYLDHKAAGLDIKYHKWHVLSSTIPTSCPEPGSWSYNFNNLKSNLEQREVAEGRTAGSWKIKSWIVYQ